MFLESIKSSFQNLSLKTREPVRKVEFHMPISCLDRKNCRKELTDGGNRSGIYLSRIIIIMELHRLPERQIIFDNIQESTPYKNHSDLIEFQNKDLQNDLKIIAQYLNLDLNFHNSPENLEIKSPNSTEAQINQENPVVDTVLPRKKQKSVFHNFQKHLITSIKKFMHLSLKQLSKHSYGQVAYQIWLAFLECNVSNKKTLNLMFGSQNANNIMKQTDSIGFSSFQRVFSCYTIDQIEAGQKLLREGIVTQAKTLSKQFLKSNSNIQNVDIFYEYFLNFLVELQKGPLSRRITKYNKGKNVKPVMND